ncbi:unnamed protein product [Sympodiomycopsis kandeliae]
MSPSPSSSPSRSEALPVSEGSKRKAVDADDGGASGNKKARPSPRPSSSVAAETSSKSDDKDVHPAADDKADDDDDDDWLQFQKDILAGPSGEGTDNTAESGTGPGAKTNGSASNYSVNATIEAAPQLVRPDGTADAESDEEETPEEIQARKAQEEREEILARLDEEQRLQDEAQSRVTSLKSRLERIRASRAAKSQPTS